jgi:hypothetical protein
MAESLQFTDLTLERWSSEAIATTPTGDVVHPHNPEAIKFSIGGWLIKCYIPQTGAIWTPQYEIYRMAILIAVRTIPTINLTFKGNVKGSNAKKKPLLSDINSLLTPETFLELMEFVKVANVLKFVET